MTHIEAEHYINFRASKCKGTPSDIYAISTWIRGKRAAGINFFKRSSSGSLLDKQCSKCVKSKSKKKKKKYEISSNNITL